MTYESQSRHSGAQPAAQIPHAEAAPNTRTGEWPLAPYHPQNAAPDTSSLWMPPTNPDYENLRLVAIGSLRAIDNCRDSLHILGYARPDEWSWPLPFAGLGVIHTATPGEMMRILTKRIPR